MIIDDIIIKKETILIFGSQGFIGKELVNKLSNEGHKLLLVTRKKLTNELYESKSFVNNDFVFSGCPDSIKLLDQITIVVNCVGEVNNKEQMCETNVVFVSKLLGLFTNMRLKKFIHLGSAGIYKKNGVITVESVIEPCNLYERTKWQADELIFKSVNKFSAQVIRPTTVIGASMPNQSFVQLLKLYKKFGFFCIANPKKHFFHYVPVETVVECISLCVNNKLNDQVYLVATDLTQEEFHKCFPLDLRKWYLPFFLVLPITMIRIRGFSKSRLEHLRDTCYFISNIAIFNTYSYKLEMMKKKIKTFGIFK